VRACVCVCTCVRLLGCVKIKVKVKVKQPHYWRGQARRVPEAEAPRFQDNRHMKVVRLSALRTGRFNPPRKYFWYSVPLEAESTPRTLCGRKDHEKIPKTRTRDLPACSAVPQLTAPPHSPPPFRMCTPHNLVDVYQRFEDLLALRLRLQVALKRSYLSS